MSLLLQNQLPASAGATSLAGTAIPRRYAKSAALSGRISSHVTHPLVARSMGTHCSNGTCFFPVIQSDTDGGCTPSAFASNNPRPRT